ncbi:MAG TPA: hypothetical protein VIT88_00985 [Pyrinomonadaceae bacterium]
MPLNFYATQRFKTRALVLLVVVSLLASTPLLSVRTQGQTSARPAQNSTELFRLERTPVEGGAELITIHGKLDGIANVENNWVPLVTVLRDTLGDLNNENDRLRYVWPLTYTRPSLRQRLSGAVPFLYTRVGNKKKTTAEAPPPVLDLSAADRDVWNRIFWTALQSLLLDTYGAPLKASSRSYRENISNYRKSHVIRALSVLTLYQSVQGEKAFSPSELSDIQARLMLADKTFGGIMDTLRLEEYYEKSASQIHDERGHNWELLRQRAEAESLYFEPLQMPDGNTTHAMLWVSKADLASQQGRSYEKRFLNIENPWNDKRLLKWQGHSETRYFDSESRPVSAGTPGALPVEMIPLALYGLDHPKIPVLLVDFRDGLNPKKREMTRRALQDVTNNVLSLSAFGNVPYFLGRTVYDFVTGRRGMDINQPSRLRTYSQLKLLLSLDQSLQPDLREDLTRQLEKVSINPLENDLETEASLARQQYKALMAYAVSPDGLPAKLQRDRRAEMVPLKHGKFERTLFRVGNVLTFGKYTHRENIEPEMEAQLSVARRLNYHTRFLREVAQSGPRIDIAWDLDEVRRSLRYIAENGSQANTRAIVATSRIFDRTDDEETRRICIESLARINNPKARKELIRISQNPQLPPVWKDLVTAYLNNAPAEPLAASTKVSAVEAAQH